MEANAAEVRRNDWRELYEAAYQGITHKPAPRDLMLFILHLGRAGYDKRYDAKSGMWRFVAKGGG